jgi:hypothetical protein
LDEASGEINNVFKKRISFVSEDIEGTSDSGNES